MEAFDVLVVGGGPAGVGAVIAAGRMGARTALIERHDVLGRHGHGRAGHDIFCNAHFDGHRLLIGGVFGELRRRLIARGRLFAPLALHKGEPPYDPVAYDEESMAMCRQAGVRVLFNTRIGATSFAKDRPATFTLADGQIPARPLCRGRDRRRPDRRRGGRALASAAPTTAR